jgi:hypothetical protein
MKTYETLDGQFVSENPGLKNTVFGRDKNGTKIVYGSVLYNNKYTGEKYFHVIDEYSWNWTNNYIKGGYICITQKEAERIAKFTNSRVYGQYKIR